MNSGNLSLADIKAAVGDNDKTAELLAMMGNRGGFGGDNGILLLFLLFMMEQQKNNNQNMAPQAVEGQIEAAINRATANQTSNQLIMEGINGNKTAFAELATMLNCDINKIETVLTSMSTMLATVAQKIDCSTDKLAGAIAVQGKDIINVMQSTGCSITHAIEKCCCDMSGKLNTIYNDLTMQNVNNTQRVVDLVNQRANITDEKINAVTLAMSQGFGEIKMQRLEDKNAALVEKVNTLERKAETADIIAAVVAKCNNGK